MARTINQAISQYVAATSDDIRTWSSGAVKRRLPRGDSRDDWRLTAGTLWDQRIFGPVVDLTCACGKFSGIEFLRIVCDRCRVKVTHSNARTIRFGHVNLPVAIPHPFIAEVLPLDAVPILPACFWETHIGAELAEAYDEIVRCAAAEAQAEDIAAGYGRVIAHLEKLFAETPEVEAHRAETLARGMALKVPPFGEDEEVAAFSEVEPTISDNEPQDDQEDDIDWDHLKFVDD